MRTASGWVAGLAVYKLSTSVSRNSQSAFTSVATCKSIAQLQCQALSDHGTGFLCREEGVDTARRVPCHDQQKLYIDRECFGAYPEGCIKPELIALSQGCASEDACTGCTVCTQYTPTFYNIQHFYTQSTILHTIIRTDICL